MSCGATISARLQNASAAAEVLAIAVADPQVLATAQQLVQAVQAYVLANSVTGWTIKTLAADPTVQQAIVTVVTAAANATGPLWLAVSGTTPQLPVSALK
jgi:hypothetical protein